MGLFEDSKIFKKIFWKFCQDSKGLWRSQREFWGDLREYLRFFPTYKKLDLYTHRHRIQRVKEHDRFVKAFLHPAAVKLPQIVLGEKELLLITLLLITYYSLLHYIISKSHSELFRILKDSETVLGNSTWFPKKFFLKLSYYLQNIFVLIKIFNWSLKM